MDLNHYFVTVGAGPLTNNQKQHLERYYERLGSSTAAALGFDRAFLDALAIPPAQGGPTQVAPAPLSQTSDGSAIDRIEAEVKSRFDIGHVGKFSNRNIRGGSKLSDHALGKAIDLHVTKAIGDRVAAWLVDNAEGLQIKYIIWYDEFWKPDGRGWRPESEGGVKASGLHRDHIHVSVK